MLPGVDRSFLSAFPCPQYPKVSESSTGSLVPQTAPHHHLLPSLLGRVRGLQGGRAAGNSCTPWLAAAHGFLWQAEEICDLAQLPNAASHKEREALSPTALLMFWGFYSFVSFYTHLQALQCTAYPPKAQWDVRMCLCLPFHLRGSLCA